jgi:hypothetical protein
VQAEASDPVLSLTFKITTNKIEACQLLSVYQPNLIIRPMPAKIYRLYFSIYRFTLLYYSKVYTYIIKYRKIQSKDEIIDFQLQVLVRAGWCAKDLNPYHMNESELLPYDEGPPGLTPAPLVLLTVFYFSFS